MKEIVPTLQFVISVDDPAQTLRTSGTVRQEITARLIGVLKEVISHFYYRKKKEKITTIHSRTISIFDRSIHRLMDSSWTWLLEQRNVYPILWKVWKTSSWGNRTTRESSWSYPRNQRTWPNNTTWKNYPSKKLILNSINYKLELENSRFTKFFTIFYTISFFLFL